MTTRTIQETGREINEMIEKIKDDVEDIFELGRFDQLSLFDLYQRLDDLSDLITMYSRILAGENETDKNQK